MAPRELRHSFVSLLSSSGLPIEDISHLVGHASTRLRELVYRKELRPALTKGARAMDVIFSSPPDVSGSPLGSLVRPSKPSQEELQEGNAP